VELIAAAAARGWLLGVVSGALREEIEGALRQLGLLGRFKVIVAAEDVAEGKPDPEGYRQALDALNSRPPLPERLVHPHEALALEDSPAGIQAAGEAGLLTLGVAHTYDAKTLTGAHAVVPRLVGLTPERIEALFAARKRRRRGAAPA
jgi:beta-phosphoglucomutase-like phosphatase (HAD superfamily)